MCGHFLNPDNDAYFIIWFKFSDGTTKTMAKSAALKVWMEGGEIDGVKFTNFGQNLVTKGQSIKVDLISVEGLKKNVKKIWDYDIVVIGTWDGAGARNSLDQTCNYPDANLISEFKKYKQSRYGLIASHDTISIFTGNKFGLGLMKDDFLVKVGGRGVNRTDEVDVDVKGVPMITNWRRGSTIVDVVKWGQVIDYPWNLSGRELHIPSTHTYGNLAMGDIWMTLRWVNSSADRPFLYDKTGYPEGCDIAYLSTNNNTAMIQTGHSNCNSTDDERKVWANLIYSLKQRTYKTVRFDHSCVDEDEPVTPTCSCLRYENNLFDMTCEGYDRETLYMYRVEGFDKNNALVGKSPDMEINTASNFSYFVYKIDTSATIDKNVLFQSGTKTAATGEESVRVHGNYAAGRFVHILGVDESGNLSPPLDYNLHEKCFLITHTNAFTDSQTRNTQSLPHIVRLFIGMAFVDII